MRCPLQRDPLQSTQFEVPVMRDCHAVYSRHAASVITNTIITGNPSSSLFIENFNFHKRQGKSAPGPSKLIAAEACSIH